MKKNPSVPVLGRLYDEVKVSTWGIQRGMDENIDPKTKLHGGGCVQDACDPFVLPRYCVSSGMARMSKNIRIGGKHQTFGSVQPGQRW